MTSRFSFARSFNSLAASYAQSTIAPISANSDALQPGASTGPDGVCLPIMPSERSADVDRRAK
jgi:hypothetical protein